MFVLLFTKMPCSWVCSFRITPAFIIYLTKCASMINSASIRERKLAFFIFRILGIKGFLIYSLYWRFNIWLFDRRLDSCCCCYWLFGCCCCCCYWLFLCCCYWLFLCCCYWLFGWWLLSSWLRFRSKDIICKIFMALMSL